MSYITFDFKCPECGAIESRMVKREEIDKQYHQCAKDTTRKMVSLPAGTRTTFRYADTKLKD